MTDQKCRQGAGEQHTKEQGLSQPPARMGRPPKPPHLRKERLDLYLPAYLVEFVEESGGDAYAQRVFEREYQGQ